MVYFFFNEIHCLPSQKKKKKIYFDILRISFNESRNLDNNLGILCEA